MYWFVFCQDHILLTDEGKIPQSEEYPLELDKGQTKLFLPNLKSLPARAALVSETLDLSCHEWTSFRKALSFLPSEEKCLAVKAAELLYWDGNSRFCSRCGAPMKWSSDISKVCSQCGREEWAQVGLAIIVAVLREDEILLVQSKNFVADFMGLVAGFVETGESLEECVQREVREETGLEVDNIEYFASQSWPFPNTVMTGFFARCKGGQLVLQESELNKGGWFKAEELPRIVVPSRISMARRLIDAWLRRSNREDVLRQLRD